MLTTFRVVKSLIEQKEEVIVAVNNPVFSKLIIESHLCGLFSL